MSTRTVPTRRPAGTGGTEAGKTLPATSPVAMALMLLAVYVAMYVAVAGAIRLIDWVQP